MKLPQGFERSTRFTGDPAFTPDGRTLILPMLNVDNTTSASSNMNDDSLADLPLEDLEDHAPSEPNEEEFFGQGGYNAVGRSSWPPQVPVDASSGEPAMNRATSSLFQSATARMAQWSTGIQPV